MFSPASFQRRQPLRVILFSILVSGMIANATPPAWWSDGDPPVINLNNTDPDKNHGMANIGQAKWMASEALRTLDGIAPSVANQIRSDLGGTAPDFTNRIVDLTVPNPKTPEWQESQKVPLLLGQLKAIAAPFYSRLNSVDPLWLQAERIGNGANYTNSIFPWTVTSDDDANKAPATIGQLKAVFSLRFETMPPQIRDIDGDGLDDAWETLHFGDLTNTADEDLDEDGLSNLQEAALASDPKSVGPDADGDGIADDWEQAYAGKFAAYPKVLRGELASGESLPSSFKLWNDTDQPVNCVLSIAESQIETSPTLGHEDSITGDITYSWEEISQTGTRLEGIQAGEFQEVIPGGFDFPFGGVTTHGVFVSVHGYLTLVAEDTDETTWLTSYDLTWVADILGFNDYLEPGTVGGVYYKVEADRLIVQFDNMTTYTDVGETVCTFQVILFSDGKIEYRYKDLAGGAANAGIGVSSNNPNLAFRLTVSEACPAPQSAIRIHPAVIEKESAVFFALSAKNFQVSPHSQLNVAGSFQAGAWSAGWHLNTIKITTDDPANTAPNVEARMRVLVDTDSDGLMDDQELSIGSSIYFADTDGDGIDDATAFATGKNPAGNDTDGDGVPDSALYSVEFEVREESRSMTHPIGFEVLSGSDPKKRYQVSTTTEEYSISGSAEYTDIADGCHTTTTTFRGDGDTHRAGTYLSEWKSAHPKDPNLGEDEYLESSTTQAEVTDSETSPTEISITNKYTTPWKVKKHVPDSDNDTVVRSGEEVITVTARTKLTDPVTYQDLWTSYLVPKEWEEWDASTPGIYGPLNWNDYNRAYFGDAAAAEFVRDYFINADFGVPATLSSPGETFADFGFDKRLKSLRWRWVRFNPSSPFGLEEAAPPASYQQCFHFLVEQQNALRSRTNDLSVSTIDETLRKGVVAIECNGSDGAGWHTVDLDEKFGDYKLDEPTCHGDLDFASVGYSIVSLMHVPLKIAVDADRNGGIEFGKDTTSPEKPHQFWINNDMDNVETDEPVEVSLPDWSGAYVTTKRDLEDFCRLKIRTGLRLDDLQCGRFKIALKLRNVTQGSPSIRVWKNQSSSGDITYLTDGTAAAAQIALSPYLGDSQYCSVIPTSHWIDNPDSDANLIFEGVAKGSAELVIALLDQSGALLGESTGVWLQLLDVREMYQRARIENEAEQIPDPWVNDNPPAQSWVWDPWDWPYVEDPGAEPVTAVFVHGWRMPYNEYLSWSQTTYKRLWHQGFRGRFYSFRWPTYSADNTVFRNNGFDNWQEQHSPVPPGGFTYNPSEYRAWLCGPALAQFVNQLPNPLNRSLFAHSMGNVISGAALRSGMAIRRYAMCNAAMAAMAYDPDPSLKNVDKIFVPLDPQDTPDSDPDPAIRTGYGLENKFNLPAVITGPNMFTMPPIINFGLPNDEALASWSANNLYFKPNPNYLYTKNSILQPFPLVYQATPISSFRPVTELPEAMGYVTKSRTRAAGAVLDTAGAVKDFVNMKTWFEEIHSAEWRWNNQSTHIFWQKLVEKLELKTQNP
jgi:hypothetical protein